jgi:hypothetical protein
MQQNVIFLIKKSRKQSLLAYVSYKFATEYDILPNLLFENHKISFSNPELTTKSAFNICNTKNRQKPTYSSDSNSLGPTRSNRQRKLSSSCDSTPFARILVVSMSSLNPPNATKTE